MVKFLDKYALRSFKQILIHICVSVGLATLFYFLLSDRVTVSSNNFVTIMSSIAAASGALLAISLAFATFMGRYVTDWRERLFERLRQEREVLRSQMKISAQHYPEISKRLTELYIMAALYIPGQEIDTNEVYKADKIFHDWAKEHASQTKRKFDFGNLDTYDSFEKLLFDAHLCSNEVRQSLIELHVAEVSGRSLATYPSLITTWAIILIFSVVSAIIGGTGIIYANLNISLLVIPAYLFLFAIPALVLDFKASMSIMRILETGYEKAMLELVNK